MSIGPDSGNHEILTLGLFQARSAKKLSREKSQGPHLPGRSIVTPNIVSLDPMTDERVIEVCQVISSAGTPEFCVSRDGYAGDFGSSFSWSGKYFEAISRPAYDHASEGRYMKAPQLPFQPISPCYTYNTTTDILINNPSLGNLSNCLHFWTTPGGTMRSACLLDLDNQPSSMFAFIASNLGVSGVHEAFDLLMGCSTLIDTPSQLLHQYFVATALAIQNSLDSEDMHGTFFVTQSNLKWMTFAKFYAKQLMMHSFIDRNTRKVSVLTVLRNLGDENLFYALVNVTFTIAVSGEVEHDFDVQYVPIIQYFYGLDGYPYIPNEVIASELLFLSSLVIVVFSTIAYKVYTRLNPSAESHSNGDGKGDKITEVLDPFGLPPPPPRRRSSSVNKADLSCLRDEEEAYALNDLDSSCDSNDEDIRAQLALQRRRNKSLSKKIAKTDMADISLRDFSSILLPDVDAADNMSSDSEEDSEDDSDEDRTKDANDNSIGVLQKQVSFVAKHSTKSMKTVTKIIIKNKTKKYKKYFSLCVLFIFMATFACRVMYILEARDLHFFLTSSEVSTTTGPGSLFTGYDLHFEDIIEKFQDLQEYEIAGRVLSVLCIFFCKFEVLLVLIIAAYHHSLCFYVTLCLSYFPISLSLSLLS